MGFLFHFRLGQASTGHQATNRLDDLSGAEVGGVMLEVLIIIIAVERAKTLVGSPVHVGELVSDDAEDAEFIAQRIVQLLG